MRAQSEIYPRLLYNSYWRLPTRLKAHLLGRPCRASLQALGQLRQRLRREPVRVSERQVRTTSLSATRQTAPIKDGRRSKTPFSSADPVLLRYGSTFLDTKLLFCWELQCFQCQTDCLLRISLSWSCCGRTIQIPFLRAVCIEEPGNHSFLP